MRTMPRMLLAVGLMLFASIAVAQVPTGDGTLDRPDGAKIHYQVSGHGQPMLLIHGYPLSGELFAKNRDALDDHYTVITLDQRGYGQSKAPDANATIQTYAKDALALLDKLQVDKAIIGGMSMGGPIALEMYREAPQRFAGLMLIDTTAKPASPPEAGLWNGMVTLIRTKGVEALPMALTKDMLTGQTRMNDMALVQTLKGIVLKASKNGALAGAKALANRPDSQPTLATIKIPTLIIVGVEDTIYPMDMAKAMQKAIPNAKLAMIPGAAHAAVIEKPDQVNQAILGWAQQVR
ncbi:alpha/beta fold hydrolase [Frateuria sp.]|uniref:alpha/beta fold hydrolase n=1 Tax=Frateuria sp. TaxID=2211372 RepID=UPI003F82030D